MAREKRYAPRSWLPIAESKSTPAAIETEGVRYTGLLLDISLSGMAIRINSDSLKLKRALLGHPATGEFLLSGKLHKSPGVIARFSGEDMIALKFDERVESAILEGVTKGKQSYAIWGPSLRVVGVLDASLRRAVFAATEAGRAIDLSGVTKVDLQGVGLLAAMLDKNAVLQGCSSEAKKVLCATGLCKRCGRCSCAS